MDMLNCVRCEGFIPAKASSCPHCDAPTGRRSKLRTLLNVAGGGAVAMTLMACYGGAPRDYAPVAPTNTNACTDPSQDLDKDGYCGDDCDEMNAAIHPGAADTSEDGIDQNCDGVDGVPSSTAAPSSTIAQ